MQLYKKIFITIKYVIIFFLLQFIIFLYDKNIYMAKCLPLNYPYKNYLIVKNKLIEIYYNKDHHFLPSKFIKINHTNYSRIIYPSIKINIFNKKIKFSNLKYIVNNYFTYNLLSSYYYNNYNGQSNFRIDIDKQSFVNGFLNIYTHNKTTIIALKNSYLLYYDNHIINNINYDILNKHLHYQITYLNSSKSIPLKVIISYFVKRKKNHKIIYVNFKINNYNIFYKYIKYNNDLENFFQYTSYSLPFKYKLILLKHFYISISAQYNKDIALARILYNTYKVYKSNIIINNKIYSFNWSVNTYLFNNYYNNINHIIIYKLYAKYSYNLLDNNIYKILNFYIKNQICINNIQLLNVKIISLYEYNDANNIRIQINLSNNYNICLYKKVNFTNYKTNNYIIYFNKFQVINYNMFYCKYLFNAIFYCENSTLYLKNKIYFFKKKSLFINGNIKICNYKLQYFVISIYKKLQSCNISISTSFYGNKKFFIINIYIDKQIFKFLN